MDLRTIKSNLLQLTDCQLEVVKLMSRGISVKDIAKSLCIEPSSVYTRFNAAQLIIGTRNKIVIARACWELEDELGHNFKSKRRIF